MFKTKNAKYVRLKYELMPSPFHEGSMVKVCRIKAVRDIPVYGILAGDIGGYLDSKAILDQKGDCWVGGDAIVLGSVNINDNALIKDRVVVHGGATVLKEEGRSGNYYGITFTENVRISGNVRLDYVSTPSERSMAGYFGGQAQISGDVCIYNARSIAGNVVLKDHVTIHAGCRILGDAKVSGRVVLEKKVSLNDHAMITDDAVIGRNSNIQGLSKVGGKTVVPAVSLIVDGKDDNPKESKPSQLVEYTGSEAQALKRMTKDSKKSQVNGVDGRYQGYLTKYQEIVDAIDAYASDIVKIIQYPAMTDLTDTHTAEMMFALKKAEFESEFSHDGEFFRAVGELEQKFLVAESNARKLASSLLSETGRKKTEQAKDLFALACNDASPEQERRMAFKQGFKRLEGVVSVPEKAVQAMRVQVGIAELEM